MPDELTDLQRDVRAFVEERGWGRFHTPKNLSMALLVEASELLEQFQWLTPAESDELDEAQREAVADEVADVMHYLLLLADRLGIDVAEAVRAKMVKNASKYPLGAKAAFERE